MIQSGKAQISAWPLRYGLVPDGVTAISLTLDNGPAITASVKNNFYVVRWHEPEVGTHTLTENWLGADGALIKTMTETFRTEIAVAA